MTHWQTAETEPTILQEDISEREVSLRLKAGANLFQFQGHFPEKAIFPGVAQLDWAVKLGQKYFQHGKTVAGVNQLKFKQFIEPEVEVQLTLSFVEEKAQIKFTFGLAEEGKQDCFSSGIIKLSAE